MANGWPSTRVQNQCFSSLMGSPPRLQVQVPSTWRKLVWCQQPALAPPESAKAVLQWAFSFIFIYFHLFSYKNMHRKKLPLLTYSSASRGMLLVELGQERLIGTRASQGSFEGSDLIPTPTLELFSPNPRTWLYICINVHSKCRELHIQFTS